MTWAERVYEAVARNLREFGYPDITAAMVEEIHAAMKTGKRFPDLPHGVIGGFAQEQLEGKEAKAAFKKDRSTPSPVGKVERDT